MGDTQAREPRCPYCLSVVSPAEDSVVCSACGIRHHRECWELNARCTTYGCNSRATAQSDEPVRPTPLPDAVASWWFPPISVTREDIFASDPVAASARRQAQERARRRAAAREAQSRKAALHALAFALLGLMCLATLAKLVTGSRSGVPTHTPSPRSGAARTALPGAPLPPAPEFAPEARRVTRLCYLRVVAGEQTPARTGVQSGAVVELIKAQGDWAHVRLESGESGYVPRNALAPIRDVPTRGMPGSRPGGRP